MLALCLFFTLLAISAAQPFLLSTGSYCTARVSSGLKGCCGGREDDCSRPMLGTICYCDEFCERGSNSDCCPDYRRVCKKEIDPPPLPVHRCYFNGKYLDRQQSVQFNCNKCTCELVSPTKAEVICEEKPCLIRPEIIEKVNTGNYGWRAANYSFLWGKSLEEGYNQRAGICKPEPLVLDQGSVQNSIDGPQSLLLNDEFDCRRKWPRLIRSVTDQMDYPASWAITTVDVASDRLSIQSKGQQQVVLSAQNLISCIHPRKQNLCSTASTDRAWWHLGVYGVVLEECYPYRSGYTGDKQHCQVNRDTWSDTSKCSSDGVIKQGTIYRTPPAYRVSSKMEDIMSEIESNGPVQALLHVRDDFFHYKSGVYRHVSSTFGHQARVVHNVHRYHAVRIIGFGVDRSEGRPVKYWLCANSWGQQWGENGYFRIERGTDESDIEMFVVGVWAKKNIDKTTQDYSNFIN